MSTIHEPVPKPGTSMDSYEIISKCGEGTYGCVYKAMHKLTKRIVALKKIVNVPKEDGSPVEIKYLQQLVESKNVVSLIDYFYNQDGHLVLIFEYMEYDLWRLMTGPSVTFNLLEIKCLIQQMLEGLQQCHLRGIMHRDIKPSNLLINSEGILKLADFGLTTSFIGNPKLSNNVVSLYYRPPELLMGSHVYGPEIDMWSVGCILIELMTNNYLFAGANEVEQLDLIFRIFGTPTESTWPGVTELPGWNRVQGSRSWSPQSLPDVFSSVGDILNADGLDLALRMLSPDPKKRIASSEALKHPWFTSSPAVCAPRKPCWNLTGTRTGSRKYQTDFSRTHGRKTAYIRLEEAASTKRKRAAVKRGGRGRGSTAVPRTHITPHCNTRLGRSANFPICIAS